MRSRSPLTLAASLVLGVALGAALSHGRSVEAKGEEEKSAVFFAPGGGIEKAIVEAIDGAKKEALVGMYLFTSRPLSEALIRAKRRGVAVRLVLDKNQKAVRYGKCADLKKAGIPVRLMALGRTGDGQEIKFHNKFLVVDGEIVETGSFNWTQQADDENWENAVIIRSRRLAADYRKQFEKAWEAAEPDTGPE
jgi:phosphatidylserine/phosphatidylglycerophosphate/cardiolipin synthase-like enzyme